MRRLTAVVALALVVSVATSVWASCMAELGMTATAQMACCAHGHEKCPMHGTPQSCCEGESQRHAQVSVANHELIQSLVSPPASVPIVIATPAAPAVERLSRLTSDRDILKGPDPPAYFLGSAFLV